MPTGTPGQLLPSPLCFASYPALILNLDVRQTIHIPEPPARKPFHDPVFGTCLVRVTDRDTDVSPGDSSLGLKNEYSRVQSFNANGSRILVRSIEAGWYLYDARTLLPIAQLPLVNEPRWDCSDPSLVYYTAETGLFVFDTHTLESHLIHDFSTDLPGQDLSAVWTRYEGSPSRDSRYWGFMAEDCHWFPTAFLVYDLISDRVTVLNLRDLPEAREDVDHVTMSTLGTYFLASFDLACERGLLGSYAHPCGLMAYKRDLTEGRGLLRIVGHYDTALDAEGREVVVFQDIDADQVSLLDLESGAITPLFPIDFSHTPIGLHFSGVAYDQPGWALVSTYSGGYPTALTWMDDQVFAVELKTGGRIVRLAHTHSIVDQEQEHDYWAEPQASTNRDFTRLLFTSNWGCSGSSEVEMYLIELPQDWIRQLP